MLIVSDTLRNAMMAAAMCLSARKLRSGDIRIRFVNVVDLMVLQPPSEHPHGMDDSDFDALFTADKPVIFAFHGSPF